MTLGSGVRVAETTQLTLLVLGRFAGCLGETGAGKADVIDCELVDNVEDEEDNAQDDECGVIHVLWKYCEQEGHLVGLALVENCQAHLEQDLGSSSICCFSRAFLTALLSTLISYFLSLAV